MLCDDVLQLLRNQRGLIALRQVSELESDPGRRRRMYATSELESASARVLRHRATPWSVEQDLMLGVLDAGPNAILWGKSAAGHWGFGRFRTLPAHVAVARKSRSSPRVARVHVIRDLAGCDRTVHDDIPIARPEVVVLWLAGMWTHRFGHEIAGERTAVALDHAWRQRLIDGRFLHALAERSGGRGRSGIVVLRQVLENRPPDYTPAGSRLEERFEEIVAPSVAADLRRQVMVDAEVVVRRVDFRLSAWPLIVEINSETFHRSLTARAADEERYERLLALGHSVVVFWEHDIWHDASTVRATMSRIAKSPDVVPTLHRPTSAPWEW